MNPITYAKIAGLVALVVALAGGGYHVGRLSGDVDAAKAKTAAEALHAAQLQGVVKALDEQARQRVLAETKLQKAENDYANTPIDPLAPVLAHRVLVYAAGAGRCDLPAAAPVAGGAQASAPIAIGPSVVEQRLNDYIAACAADAAQMKAMLELAP